MDDLRTCRAANSSADPLSTTDRKPSALPDIPPPPELTWLVECLGVEDTVRLIEISGGLTVWVPSGVGNNSVSLRKQFDTKYGSVLAQKLVRYYGGGSIKVPLAPNWRTALYRNRGMSVNDIARELRCSTDTVYRRLRRGARRAKSGKASTPPDFLRMAATEKRKILT